MKHLLKEELTTILTINNNLIKSCGKKLRRRRRCYEPARPSIGYLGAERKKGDGCNVERAVIDRWALLVPTVGKASEMVSQKLI